MHRYILTYVHKSSRNSASLGGNEDRILPAEKAVDMPRHTNIEMSKNMFCNSIIKRGWSNHNSTGKVRRLGSPVQISFKYNFWTDVAWRREAATEKPLLLSSWIDRIREHLSVSHCNRYPESPRIRVERAKLSTREKLEYATAGHKWPRYLPGLAFFLGFTASMKHAKKKNGTTKY